MDNVRLWQSPEGEYILVCSLKINSRLGNPTSFWAYDAGYHQSQAQPRLVMRCLSSEQGQTSSSAALHQPGKGGLASLRITPTVPRFLGSFRICNLQCCRQCPGKLTSPAAKVWPVSIQRLRPPHWPHPAPTHTFSLSALLESHRNPEA